MTLNYMDLYHIIYLRIIYSHCIDWHYNFVILHCNLICIVMLLFIFDLACFNLTWYGAIRLAFQYLFMASHCIMTTSHWNWIVNGLAFRLADYFTYTIGLWLYKLMAGVGLVYSVPGLDYTPHHYNFTLHHMDLAS